MTDLPRYRALSAALRERRGSDFEIEIQGRFFDLRYEPGESTVNLFGGNSNWRGPIWFPVNYLLIQALRKYHTFYGDDFVVECPVGSGRHCSLAAAADELSDRLIGIFALGSEGRRPALGNAALLQRPEFRDHLLFHEYFNGDDGRGHGAAHQTGWTGLVATLIGQRG